MTSEAHAQSHFLSALFRQSDCIAGAKPLHADSLQAYRGNVSASVARALAVMYPTVAQCLGDDDFAALARLHLSAHPPQRGDWGQYGWGFADWLRSCNPGGVTAALPFLPDVAALDAARYHAEAAADASLEPASLGALTGDATQLTIVFHPAVAVLDCEYDVLNRALNTSLNTAPSTAPHSACLNTTAITATPSPHTLLIWRDQWRAQTAKMTVCDAEFVRFCLNGATVHVAAQQAAAASPEASFDFASWLAQALQRGLITRIAPLGLSA